jgi:DNA-binding transcriptional regulator YhcF (GntR family)
MIQKTVSDLTPYPTIKNMMKVFLDIDNSKSKNADVKESLETFIQKYTDDQFKNLRDTTYATELRKFVNKIRKHDIALRAYDYVSTNADYTDDPDKSQIDQIIRDKFKNFQSYSSALLSLAKTRRISNPYWKLEADKFVGSEKGKIRAKQENNEEQGDDIFELLSQCRSINARCKKNKKPMAVKYLNIGLDELKFGSGDKDKGSAKTSGFSTDNVYEAYIQTNVIKGKITRENYTKLKCSYLNYSLGSMYKRMMKQTKENFIIGNKVYFDLEKQIAKVEEKLQKEKKLSAIANDTKTKRKNEEKKGGRRRTRKRRRKQKRNSIHKSRKKRFLKVNKTHKVHYSS